MSYQWYEQLAKLDENGEVTFLNLGYSYLDKSRKKIKLDKQDEKNRNRIQLYHYLVSTINIRNKDVLEVGCGRGGGSAFIKKYLKPKTLTGIDLSKSFIKFCEKTYSIKGLSFHNGNAEKMFFKNNSFDAIINLESSHNYKNMGKFLSEVYRILKPGGYLLFADFRYLNDLINLKKEFKENGLNIEKEEIITPNVLKALDEDENKKQKITNRKVKKILHRAFNVFSVMKDTPLYNSLKTGDAQYLLLVLRKTNSKSSLG